jgi:hypothetical protein
MPEDLRNQRWVLDTGNDSQLSPAIGTGFEIEEKLEKVGASNRLVRLKERIQHLKLILAVLKPDAAR